MFTSSISPLLIISSLALGTLAAIGPVTKLHLANDFIAPDGFNRSAVLANGVFPAPLIHGQTGDTFEIDVHDHLTNDTMERAATIHWHGIFQHHSNWADGVAMVSQCPIVPGESFKYKFDTHHQAGTFWYHSHFQTQYCDGLRGPLVIYDPNDPYLNMYDVDNEHTVITLADWQHQPTSLAPVIPTNISSVLINGKGTYENGPTDLSIIIVKPGKRYRFRLVSISCDPNFTFSIDGHNMTIIEVDGILHEPLLVDQIQIFAGQRYSFILEANQTIQNYWIRAIPGPIGFQTSYPLINSAILRYIGAPNGTTDYPNTTETNSTMPLNEINLHPLVSPAPPGKPYAGGADYTMSLPINFAPGNATARSPINGNFSVNGTTFQSPDVPVLLQILNGVPAQSLLPNGSVYPLPANSSIELSFPMIGAGTAGGPHPVHLHGHNFSVIRSAGTNSSNSSYNYMNPVRRDVVSIGNTVNDSVTIRFDTNNPGPWILHCHIDYHLANGFAVVMAEDVADTSSTENVPNDYNALCPAYNAFITNGTSSSQNFSTETVLQL